jgi:hypothetical protein
MTNLYGNIDPRDIPTYSIGDAARYLRIPTSTIRSWTIGRDYRSATGSKEFKPLIPIREHKPRLLSFRDFQIKKSPKFLGVGWASCPSRLKRAGKMPTPQMGNLFFGNPLPT